MTVDDYIQQHPKYIYLMVSGKDYLIRDAWAAALAAQPSQASPTCVTCNGHGMIGGPSYYAPDEGGVPCPDCAQPSQARTAEAMTSDKGRITLKRIHLRLMAEDRAETAKELSKTILEVLDYLDRIDPLADPKPMTLIQDIPPASPVAPNEREGFEACLKAGTFDIDRVSDFSNCETEAAWRGWQARALLAARTGEGHV